MAQDRKRGGDMATGRRGERENVEGFIATSHSPRRPVAPCQRSLRSSQRQPHVLLVVSLSLIVITRPTFATSRPDLACAIGLMFTSANILLPRSVSRLPTRFVSPLPV